MENSEQALHKVAEQLRSVAAFGLNFAQHEFDRERWETVLAASAAITAVLNNQPAAELLARYQTNFFEVGPMASGEAAVFQGDKLLLIRRSDDGLWALPGGITDAGETLAETAVRELHEEAGIVGEAIQLMGIFDSRLWHSEKKIHFYHAVFLIKTADFTPQLNDESTAAAYFGEDELPPLSPGHHLRAPFLFQQLRGEAPLPFFDSVSPR